MQKLEYSYAPWVVALGDQTMIHVRKYLWLDNEDGRYAPVKAFVAEHGLVLATSGTDTEQWDDGSVWEYETQTFMTPAYRNISMMENA